jgi:uncharacterized RDD family membrane protein YckC
MEEEKQRSPAQKRVKSLPEADRSGTQNGTLDSLMGATERVVAPVARAGWRGARRVARRLGIDRRVSDAVESGTSRALDSETAARATERLLENETAKRVWEKVLESDEAQKLVERVAEAPELRAAIASQGVGLLQDFRRGIRRAARHGDTVVERFARRIIRRPVREGRPIYTGAFSRLLALGIDAGVVYGSLLLITAAIAAVVAAIANGDQNGGTVVIAIGAAVWALIAAVYLIVLWSGAGRTVGMSFLGLRMISMDGQEVRPGQAIRRLIWMPISALPFFLGFAGILYNQERRGWPDRRAGTVVCYADPDLDKGLV